MFRFFYSDYDNNSLDWLIVFSRASNHDKHTIEFRALDMPKTWDEAERHIRFVDALIEYIHRMKLEQVDITIRLNKGSKIKLAKTLAARWPYGRSAAAFEALVKQLGLRWDDYRPYLRNLRQRYKLGTTN